MIWRSHRARAWSAPAVTFSLCRCGSSSCWSRWSSTLAAIVGREELCRVVWGRELRQGDRSVDVYVSKLRAKLEHAVPDRRYIHTHPSFGYRFQPEQLLGPEVEEAGRAASAEGGLTEQPRHRPATGRANRCAVRGEPRRDAIAWLLHRDRDA